MAILMPVSGASPSLGQRVRLKKPHPWAGTTGVVVRLQVIKMFSEDGPLPLVRLDDAPGFAGREVFITQPDQWKAL